MQRKSVDTCTSKTFMQLSVLAFLCACFLIYIPPTSKLPRIGGLWFILSFGPTCQCNLFAPVRLRCGPCLESVPRSVRCCFACWSRGFLRHLAASLPRNFCLSVAVSSFPPPTSPPHSLLLVLLISWSSMTLAASPWCSRVERPVPASVEVPNSPRTDLQDDRRIR